VEVAAKDLCKAKGKKMQCSSAGASQWLLRVFKTRIVGRRRELLFPLWSKRDP
jgi:hypothetical protein